MHGFLQKLGKFVDLWYGLLGFFLPDRNDSHFDLIGTLFHLTAFGNQAVVQVVEAAVHSTVQVFQVLTGVPVVLAIFQEAHRAEGFLARHAEEELLGAVEDALITYIFLLLGDHLLEGSAPHEVAFGYLCAAVRTPRVVLNALMEVPETDAALD